MKSSSSVTMEPTPNLCSGVLVLSVDGKEFTFPRHDAMPAKTLDAKTG